jgi:hypothetical protein
MAQSILESNDSIGGNEFQSMHPLISWRSVVAGLVISFFFMIGFLGLGMAFGGIGMSDGTTAKSAGIFTGAWFLGSSLISLFIGSYFAARISKFQMGRVGSAQGLVIAALFLGLFLVEAVMAIGGIGQLTGSILGNTAGMVTTGAQKLSSTPVVRDMVDDAVGDLNLKSDPRSVATGIATRLIRGDAEGAKNYLVRESGITMAQAEQRIASAKSKIDGALVTVREGASAALKSTGWALFFLVFLGSISAVLGGSLGSVTNFRKPLAKKEYFASEQHV